MTLLAVRDLRKAFGGVTAVRDVSFILEASEMVALIGPNGAGKSTVFNMIGGQLRPDRGTVHLAGMPVTRLAPHEKFRLGIGRTFQVAQAFRSMTVAENVQMALISDRNETRRLWSPARDRCRGEAMALLAQVGMAEAADRPCSVLAYGDVKRLELAVALASRPKLLLMDEPTAGMAPRERASLMDLTAALTTAQGIGVLFTEHDMDVVFGHAQRVLVLVRGEILADGSPEEIRSDPRVRAAYLGQSEPAETGR
jgi:branched-chain amino acid transport system ATP-binding protein